MTKTIPAEARTKNVSSTASCRWCADAGVVVVAAQKPPYGDDTGPCPYCEHGAEIEFGETGQKRWPGGFWVRYGATKLEPLYEVPGGRRLPDEENHRRWRELKEQRWPELKSM